MIFHSTEKDELLSFFDTDREKGLTGEKASKLLEKYGTNKLREKKKKTLIIFTT